MIFECANLNKVTNAKGFRPGEIMVIASERNEGYSMVRIECKYGHIMYKFLTDSPSYNIKSGEYEVDIDYSQNEFDSGYVLKGALYHYDEIIGFDTYECYNLRAGLIKLTESLLSSKMEK